MQTTNTPNSQTHQLDINRIFYALSTLVLCFVLSPAASSLAEEFDGRLKTVAITDTAATNSPPTAVIHFSKEGDIVNFDASNSSDLDGNVVSYIWDFGDGTKAAGVTVSHQLTNENPQVTLTVADDKGGIALTQIVVGTTVLPWKLHYVDSEELVGENGGATNAFDGDPATIWHTEYRLLQTSYPHEIQINLGAMYSIDGIRYLPRQDGGINGTISQYAIYVSTDGIDWGNTVAQGTFTANTAEKEVLFPSTNGQFIRLVALSEINNKTWTSLAELNILYN